MIHQHSGLLVALGNMHVSRLQVHCIDSPTLQTVSYRPVLDFGLAYLQLYKTMQRYSCTTLRKRLGCDLLHSETIVRTTLDVFLPELRVMLTY